MRRVTRRALIGGTVAATGLAAFTGYRVFEPMANQEGAIAGFIAQQVPAVAPGDEAVTSFATEILGAMGINYQAHLDVHVALLANPFFKTFLSSDQLWLQSNFERMLVTRFLHSTDVLLQTEPGPVTYLGLADPYLAGCSNRLAEFA